MKHFLALVTTLALSGCIEYSDGDRVGTIVKFSKKGLFCKTWEGEMVLGGMKPHTTANQDGSLNTSMVANIWRFTVENERLVPLIKAKLEGGQTATLSYREELFSFCRSDSNSYFVTAVK